MVDVPSYSVRRQLMMQVDGSKTVAVFEIQFSVLIPLSRSTRSIMRREHQSHGGL